MATNIFDLYFMDHGMLKEESGRLNFLLTQEKTKLSDVETRIIQMSKDLEEMTAQFVKQKSISQEKEKEIKPSQQSLNLLLVQKDKNNSLQEQLDTAQKSYQELNSKFESDLRAAKQQVEGLERALETEKKSHADEVSVSQQLINNLRDEQEALRQQMFQERTSLQQTSQETQDCLQREIDHIKSSYQELSSMYENDLLSAKGEAEKLQHDLNTEVKAHAETAMKNMQLINSLRAERDAVHQRMAQEIDLLKQISTERETRFQAQLDDLKVQLEQQIKIAVEAVEGGKRKNPSVWKRIRHFFGLRKSEKCKKK